MKSTKCFSPLLTAEVNVANVVTYVLNSFGNNGGQVSAAEVAEIKNK